MRIYRIAAGEVKSKLFICSRYRLMKNVPIVEIIVPRLPQSMPAAMTGSKPRPAAIVVTYG